MQTSHILVVEPQGASTWIPESPYRPVFPSEWGYPHWIIPEPGNTYLCIKSLKSCCLLAELLLLEQVLRHASSFGYCLTLLVLLVVLPSVYTEVSHFAFKSLCNFLDQWDNNIGILGSISQMKGLNEVIFAKIFVDNYTAKRQCY